MNRDDLPPWWPGWMRDEYEKHFEPYLQSACGMAFDHGALVEEVTQHDREEYLNSGCGCGWLLLHDGEYDDFMCAYYFDKGMNA